MTSESATPSAGGKPAPPARAQTLPFQRLANSVVRALLRAPLIGPAMGGRLVTLFLVGRRSGRHYDIPVAYTLDGQDLLIGTPFGWGRNLRTGEPADLRAAWAAGARGFRLTPRLTGA
jgi:hypothetical protein